MKNYVDKLIVRTGINLLNAFFWVIPWHLNFTC